MQTIWQVWQAGILMFLLGFWVFLPFVQGGEQIFFDQKVPGTTVFQPHFSVGVTNLKKGDLIGTLVALQETDRLSPQNLPTPNKLSALVDYNYGTELFKKGHVDRAITEWKSAIRKDPNLTEAHYALGQAFLSLGDELSAVAEFKEVLRQRSDWAEAFAQLGFAQYQLHELDKAEDSLLKAIHFKPNLAQAHVNLGLVRFLKDDRPGAITAYQAAIRLNREIPEAYFNLGVVRVSRGEWTEAIQHLEKARQMDPEIGSIHQVLGLAYMATGDWAQTISLWREALRRKPESPDLHDRLGRVFFNTGNWTEAVAEFEKAVVLSPNNARAYFQLGVAQQARGKLAEAIEAFQQASTLDQTWAQPLLNWGQALTHRPEQAIPLYQQAIARNKNYADAYYQLGLTYAVLDQEEAMVEAFREAAERGLTTAQTDLGTAYFTGSGVSQNVVEAMHWWFKGAMQGSAEAWEHLSDRRRTVFKSQGKSKEVGMIAQGFAQLREEWRKQSLLQFSHLSLPPIQETSVGGSLAQAGWGQEAIHTLVQEAYLLDEGASSHLERAYQEGIPPQVGKYDHRIQKYFQVTAKEGRRQSCRYLRDIHRQGWGVPRNLGEARRWERQCGQ